ncbi:hypothetical protein F5J12DRAFT_924235 [Pisolithus orientalis]|uniref:uncharacterized protein n=1 Tax=Pisolithus orientalis TaxID=936130 RepID=UPI002224D352|nr:uncharacterized protein F5J12DRAFT_924235 [Pisolithus orientalis]KAI6035401.1 hypothetical protein F5J12DRAFT_924235 [Pisolithus orientalis]
MAWFDSWTEETYALIMRATVGSCVLTRLQGELPQNSLHFVTEGIWDQACQCRPQTSPKRGQGYPPRKNYLACIPAHRIKEAGKETHLRAAKTRAAYSGHVHRARSWLQSHFPEEGTPPTPNHTGEDSEIYSDPNFKNVFERMPNRCSDKALALYLSWRGFQENSSQSTIDGVRAGFKMLWDEATNTFGVVMWHHNDAHHRWEGNPVLSAEVDDVVASIRHKVSSEGAERKHSGAMKKEYMDKILAWSESFCPLDTPLQYIRLVTIGYKALPSGESLNGKVKLTVTQHLEHLAFSAVAFTLWMRNYELLKLKRGDVKLDKTVIDGMFMKYLRGEELSLTVSECNAYFEIHLKNRKGWQRKLDKGMREADLQSNRYKIYPRPDMGKACDTLLHLVSWMKWVELVHLGRPMTEEDFLFPAIGTNGVLQPGEPLSHDTIQKWIDEAVVGSGIPRTFTTHCYRRGGAQYRFMFAPVGQRWTLARVWWWGGWAEGEHRDTLMHYLLNELNCYENDHSDALQPVPREGDRSLAGEAALVRPASTEALNMAHASITANMAALHTTVKEVKETSCSLSVDVREICQQLSDMSNLVIKALTLASAYSAPSGPVLRQGTTGSNAQAMPITAYQHSPAQTTTSSPPVIQSTSMPTAAIQSTSMPAAQPYLPTLNLQPTQTQFRMPRVVQLSDLSPSTSLPSQIGPQRTKARASTSLLGVVILDVPVLRPDGTWTAKSDSWRDIVHHWTEGEPRLDLHIPLKDWPYHYYNGKSGRQFNTKFQGDEETFLKVYGSAVGQGHTKLLKAILAARKQYCGAGERHRHLTSEEVCDDSSSGISKQH